MAGGRALSVAGRRVCGHGQQHRGGGSPAGRRRTDGIGCGAGPGGPAEPLGAHGRGARGGPGGAVVGGRDGHGGPGGGRRDRQRRPEHGEPGDGRHRRGACRHGTDLSVAVPGQ
ncbi:hypothetical protein LK07_06155 [Streptomyces pluripotens]|uniref:Uncharacterized protein n=1 Tax=Streptomyces pluripotens TaxID=1355015 RepID=A0A221NV63_9ACTN|nr:hypothetical protein LK07_06155 [Streptomyces pluripotens]